MGYLECHSQLQVSTTRDSNTLQSNSDCDGASITSDALTAFWREHDRTLAQDGSFDDVMLSHDLYRGMPSWFNAFYAYFQRRAVSHLLRECRLAPGMSVLDIGCGTGRWTGLMLKMGMRPWGVDMGEQALHYAARQWPGALFSCGKLPYLAFAEGSFDLVISVVVLQHVPHEQQSDAIREISRVLRLGGYVIICESIDTDDPSPHVFGNKPECWLEMFSNAGFQLVAQSACEYLPYVKIFHWSRQLLGKKVNGLTGQGSVSQVAQLLRAHPFLAVFVRLVIIMSYPFEYMASWVLPARWARLTCFLLRKD